MKASVIGVAAMLLVIGMMSAMPMASAEEQQMATLYKVTLLKGGEAFDMGEIVLEKDFLPDRTEIKPNPYVAILIEKVKDMLTGSELRAINTVGFEAWGADAGDNVKQVTPGTHYEGDGQYYKTGPCIWIDPGLSRNDGTVYWVYYGYQPVPTIGLL